MASMAHAHNTVVKVSTGYAPRELRFLLPGPSSLLDLEMRFTDAQIHSRDYVSKKDGTVDFDKFYEGTRAGLLTVLTKARDCRMARARQIQARYNEKRVRTLRPNDLVLLKEKDSVPHKFSQTRRYGWRVVQLIKHKNRVEIRNELIKGMPNRVVHASKIRRVLESVWKDPTQYLCTSLLRMRGKEVPAPVNEALDADEGEEFIPESADSNDSDAEVVKQQKKKPRKKRKKKAARRSRRK